MSQDRLRLLLLEKERRRRLEAAGEGSPPSTPDRPDVDTMMTQGGEEIPVFRSRPRTQTDTGGFASTLTGEGDGYTPPAGEGEGVGILTQASIGGQSPDPELRARTYQKAKPGEYKILEGGEVVRKGGDNVYYSATPSGLKKVGASILHDIPATMASGTAMALGGPIMGPVAGGGVEATVEAGERFIARNVMGEKGSKTDAYVIRPLVRGVVATGAGLVGSALGKGGVAAANKASRTATRGGMSGKIVKNLEPVDAAETATRKARFDRFGMTPGTARTTQSDIIASVQEEVGRLPGAAGRTIREADEAVQGQITRAATEGRGGLPRTLERAEQDKAGLELVKAAQGVKDNLYRLRKQRVQPLYKQASEEAEKATGGIIDISGTMKRIDSNIKSAASVKERNLWKSIKADFYKPGKGKKVTKVKVDPKTGKPTFAEEIIEKNQLQTHIDQLDQLQKHMSARITNQADQKKWGTKLVKDKMSEVRKWLLDDISNVAPSYGKATEKWGRYSKAIRRFEGETGNSIMGKAADATPDKYAGVVDSLFSKSSSPRSIRNVKARVVKQGGGGVERWKKVTEGAMSDTIERLQTDLDIPKWKMENLKAALEPEQYVAVVSFRDALRDIGFVPWAKRGGGAGKAVLEREVGGVVPRVTKRATLSPYIQSKIMSENAVRKAAPRIAKEISTDEGVQRLLRLRQLPPSAEKTAAVLSYIGLRGVGASVVEEGN